MPDDYAAYSQLHDTNNQLAQRFLDHNFKDSWARRSLPSGVGYEIDPDALDNLTDNLQDFIAHVISSILDAGSERDAVNESDDLYTALHDELRSWSSAPTD